MSDAGNYPQTSNDSARRWQRAKQIFSEAIEGAPENRSQILDRECGADAELRAEVESLIESYESAADLMEPRPAPPDSPTLKISTPHVPRRLGPWEIVSEIGAGGMGHVFRAVRADDAFEKTVAIKIVRRNMVSEYMVRRFRSERQILATLEHPNIARLMDGGTTPDGLPYLVMEFVDGVPIAEFCDQASLPIRDRLRIFLAVCSAVQYAHEKNIIHRDLKPNNVLVTKDGTPKLLDFGIARLIADTGDDERTVTNRRMMTPAYASPEQLHGDPCTAESDIYSLGVLLYELLSGVRPEPGVGTDTATALSRAVLRRESTAPEVLAKQRRTTVEDLIAELASLDSAVMKAIRSRPSERYRSVEEFAGCLRPHVTGAGSDAGSVVERRSLAVLPFRVVGPDVSSAQEISAWLADSLIIRLSRLRNVTVYSTRAVLRYTDADPLDAGAEMGSDFVVDGRIYATETRIRVNVQLMGVRAKSAIWAAQFDEAAADVLKLQDSLAGQVAFALMPQLSGTGERERERQNTASAQAYQNYLKGRWHWSQRSDESLAKALLCFEQALAADPQYARAHSGVADYYNRLGVRGGMPPKESFAAAKDAARRAIAIDSLLAEGHASLGFAVWCLERDYSAAERELQRAVELDSRSPDAYHWLGMLYSSMGRHEEALANYGKAYELDASAAIAARYAMALLNVSRLEKALDLVTPETGYDPNHWLALKAQAWCLLAQKNYPAALQAAQRAVDLSERNPDALCCHAVALAESGDSAGARAIYRDLTILSGQRYVSPYYLALIAMALQEKRACLRHLENAEASGDFFVLWTKVEKRFEPLRSTARFQRILARLAEETSNRPVRTRFALPKAWLAGMLAALLCLGAAWAFWKFGRSTPAPFAERNIARLTTDGNTAHAAISPDGKYVAYSVRVSEGQELWIRRLSSNSGVKLVNAVRAELHRIAFSGDSSDIFYVVTPWAEPANATLYRAPVIGGVPEAMMKKVPGPVGVSPDGSRIALLRSNAAQHRDELVLRDLNGPAERIIASRTYPDRFSWPSTPVWSADSANIVCGVEGSDAAGFRVSLATVRVRDGKVTVLARPRWQFLEQAAWAGNSQGILAVGQQADFSFQQLWYVPVVSRPPSRLLDDLNDYTGLTVTRDSKQLVSVRLQTLTSVYLQKTMSDTPLQITPAAGRYFDLSWTPDGRLLYSSDAAGTADVWAMNADGSARTQLTSGSSRSYAPVASPAGDLIAFHSNRSKNWNLWIMNIDGSGARQLTFGTADSNWPQFTPDGRSVVYHHTGADASWNIWRVPAEGGDPVQLTHRIATHPAVNPKDGRIACWYSEQISNPRLKLAVLPPDGGEPLQSFAIPQTVSPDTTIQWMPDGKALTFIDARGGAGNLWLQPLDGQPARAITSFKNGQIFSYVWSPNGTLAFSRGLSMSDAVLLRDTQK